MDDGEYPPKELVHAGDLVEVLLADLQHLQRGQPEQVGPKEGLGRGFPLLLRI